MEKFLNYKKTKHACYYTYLSMSSVFSLPPILFTVFHEMYGLSFTLLGTLIVVNFCTQLAVDLLFSVFGKHFNSCRALQITPLLTGAGFIIYALVPLVLPHHAYAGLLTGTIIFSLASGLGEVLVSPAVESLPSDTHDKDMATLHSLYGYGVVLVVAVSTGFLALIGKNNWMYLCLFWAILPVIASILLFCVPTPNMEMPSGADGVQIKKRACGLLLCMLCIFFGACAENVMTNWMSSYLEISLNIPKATGDIFGFMLFAVLLSLTRTWYAKKGKNIYRTLLISMIGAIVCYIVAGLSPFPLISMIACVLTGVTTAMLWPGTLIYMDKNIPYTGVTAYALMAAGGDLGASVAPELLGIITDTVSTSSWGISFSQELSITPDQLGMRVGMFVAVIFPIFGVIVLLSMRRFFKKNTLLKSSN